MMNREELIKFINDLDTEFKILAEQVKTLSQENDRLRLIIRNMNTITSGLVTQWDDEKQEAVETDGHWTPEGFLKPGPEPEYIWLVEGVLGYSKQSVPNHKFVIYVTAPKGKVEEYSRRVIKNNFPGVQCWQIDSITDAK